jgi:hypothetical protein
MKTFDPQASLLLERGRFVESFSSPQTFFGLTEVILFVLKDIYLWQI